MNLHKAAYSGVLAELLLWAWSCHFEGGTELSPLLLWPVDPHSDFGWPWLRGARKRHACKEEREVPSLTFSYCCYQGWWGKYQRPFHFGVCQDAKAKGFEFISVQPITKVFTVKGLLSCPVCSSFKHEGCPAEKSHASILTMQERPSCLFHCHDLPTL